jgi:hypothetical protein
MASYKLGSKGPEVVKIQERLAKLGHYLGPSDGRFGGGTESALIAFQNTAGLVADGVAGPATWRALFKRNEVPEPEIVKEELAYRCLALTASFETGAPPPDCFSSVVGDFDGQGLSFGALQFSLGPGRLGELVAQLDARHPGVIDEVFHRHAAELRTMLESDRDERLAWARTIQDHTRHRLNEPWRGLFKGLGRRTECQEVQVELAHANYESALGLCREYGLWSERGVALMFDVIVQNGSISRLVRAQIMADFTALGERPRDALEVQKMLSVARRRAAVVRPEYVESVRARKSTIALGKGRVHGHTYDLAADYGIRLVEAPELMLPKAKSNGQSAPVAVTRKPARGVRA